MGDNGKKSKRFVMFEETTVEAGRITFKEPFDQLCPVGDSGDVPCWLLIIEPNRVRIISDEDLAKNSKLRNHAAECRVEHRPEDFHLRETAACAIRELLLLGTSIKHSAKKKPRLTIPTGSIRRSLGLTKSGGGSVVLVMRAMGALEIWSASLFEEALQSTIGEPLLGE